MRFFKSIKLVSLFILISCVGQGNVIAGPKNWSDAEKYIPIQQKQFCDLKNRFLSNLYDAYFSRNEIKINMVKKQRQEDLDALFPERNFNNWIVKVVSVKQVKSPSFKDTDGDVAAVFELPCGTQIGSGEFTYDKGTRWGATIDYGSRQYREVAKLSTGEFAIISGSFVKLNDFLPNQRETFYASRPLTSADLENIKNSKYGNGDELFVAALKYVAAAN